MARKQIVTIHDDLDDAVTEDVQVAHFMFAGDTYKIDLGPENRAKLDAIFNELEEKLAPFAAVAQKLPKRNRKRK